MLSGLLILAVAATVSVRIEEAADLSLRDAMAIAEDLGRSIARVSGAELEVEDPIWAPCPEHQRCPDLGPARPAGSERVSLRIFRGVSLVRVRAARNGGAAIDVDLPAEIEARSAALASLATRLFPSRLAAPPSVTASLAPAVETAPASPWPWIAVGVAAVAGGVGIGFGLSSRDARAASQVPDTPAFDELADRTQAHAMAADILFVSAGVALASALVLAWVDH